jgi:NADH-quinone oxidoreductase subunit E
MKDGMQERLDAVFSSFHGQAEELIPILQAVQEEFSYLPEITMRRIAEFIAAPESKVYAVATFYAQFRFQPRGRNHVMVCRGTACHVRGAPAILEEITAGLGLQAEGTTEDLEYTVETVACIGCCALAPAIVYNEEVHGNLTKDRVRKLLEKEGRKNGSQ